MSATDPEVGLCAGCAEARTIVTARSTFYRCARARRDPAFRPWPELPVLVCAGFEAGRPQSATKPGGRKESASPEA